MLSVDMFSLLAENAHLLILFFSFVLFTEKDPDHNLPHSRYHHFNYNFIIGFNLGWHKFLVTHPLDD